MLLHLERRYQAYGFSNVQLVVDVWWAIIVVSHLVSHWTAGAATALFVSGAAFAIYWVTVRVGLRAAGLGARAGGPTMLLLRVFGFQKRTERLFDRVAERWRFEGPVAMIAGADLALRSVDLDEAIAESRYVSGPAHLTQANAGCVFELEQLSALGAAGRCVFVIDSTTDRTLAERNLGLEADASAQPAWVMMKREAPTMPGLWRELMQRAGVASAQFVAIAAVTDARRRGVSWKS